MNKKPTCTILFILFVLVVAASIHYMVPTHSSGWNPERMKHICAGMSEAEVFALCGNPLEIRERTESKRIWSYATPNILDWGLEAYVCFVSGKVVYACIEQQDLGLWCTREREAEKKKIGAGTNAVFSTDALDSVELWGQAP
jgi:hypothetical protein